MKICYRNLTKNSWILEQRRGHNVIVQEVVRCQTTIACDFQGSTNNVDLLNDFLDCFLSLASDTTHCFQVCAMYAVAHPCFLTESLGMSTFVTKFCSVWQASFFFDKLHHYLCMGFLSISDRLGRLVVVVGFVCPVYHISVLATSVLLLYEHSGCHL